MPISDDIVSFLADLVGVPLGAFLGYLLGLRQQRQIDSERDDRRRQELKSALKAELEYLVREISDRSESSSEFFRPLPFNVLFLDLPTFNSIVNSGQLLLLDSRLVHSLRELNSEVHEHNVVQYVFAGVGLSTSSDEFALQSQEFKRIIANADSVSDSRLGGLLKVVIDKGTIIVKKPNELIQEL